MDDIERLINDLKATKALVHLAVAKGVSRAGLRVEGDAKRMVAVDTGRLRGSINTVVESTPTGATATVGTAVGYASFVEYGTGERGNPEVDHRVDWLGTPPHPFLRPALQLNQDAGNIDLLIKNEVKRVFK